MAEAAAALYAIETAVEGAAVGAFAVSQSTTPLHIRFRKLATSLLANFCHTTTGSTLNVVGGKAYIFGGDTTRDNSNASMEIVTLPSDIENGECDYQLKEPEYEPARPLEQYSLESQPQNATEGFENVPAVGGDGHSTLQQEIQARAAHASTSIDQNIFVLTGRRSRTSRDVQGSEEIQAHLFNCDQVYSFSTMTNKWFILRADVSNCKDGVPVPRTGASCTSTPHPQPESAVSVTTNYHGTIFLHGGYDAQNEPLRDTWAFDVSSRIWTRWPDIPDPLPEEIAGEGKVVCTGKRLWRAGDGFGKMTHIGFDVVRGNVVGETSGPVAREVEVKPKTTKWITSSSGKSMDSSKEGSEKKLVDKTETVPVPRKGAGLAPITTGAGRLFLLYFMGQDGPGSVLGDVWSFQIRAEENTPAAVKDIIRNAIGKDSGENRWAPCDIVESTKDEGEVHPPQGLYGFAADTWVDLGGGNVLLWGGMNAGGQPQNQCWIMSVE